MTLTKKSMRTYSPLLWILMIPVLNVFYSVLNRPGPKVYSLITDLDRAIPFIPAFIIPYSIWYPFIASALVLFFFKDRSLYYRALVTLCLGLVSCYAVYAVFQTTVHRPVLSGEGLLKGMVNFVYANDQPFNCFPSIHVLTSYIMIKGLRQLRSMPTKLRLALITIGWSIIASTVFVKQHVLLDAAGAIMLVEILFGGAKWLVPLHKMVEIKVDVDRITKGERIETKVN
jgi:hypothetical protein